VTTVRLTGSATAGASVAAAATSVAAGSSVVAGAVGWQAANAVRHIARTRMSAMVFFMVSFLRIDLLEMQKRFAFDGLIIGRGNVFAVDTRLSYFARGCYVLPQRQAEAKVSYKLCSIVETIQLAHQKSCDQMNIRINDSAASAAA
jgi:hypothetical protein